MEAVAGRAVVVARLHAAPDRVAAQRVEVEAAQAAVGAEDRGARMAGAGPALVVVGVADHADAVAELERIEQEPLERAPRRMDLDRALDRDVVAGVQVGIAAADVGERERAFAVAVQRLEQVEHMVAVGLDVRQVLDQRVRAAPDRPAFVEEEDVAVAAEMRDRRVLVAGNRDEAARRMELGVEPVQLGPERRRRSGSRCPGGRRNRRTRWSRANSK